ncbi:MAG: SAM-dependent methyltransferase [Clostridia bacterium]|nr:SAM-dependent methyltransferase [Clostridia bacterium]
MNHALPEKIVSLIFLAAKEQKLRKAIFSKPDDKSIQKVVLTLRIHREQLLLQAETFHRDNKVTHKNFLLDPSVVPSLTDFGSAFSQINLITTEGECEYRYSSSGKCTLLGGDKLEKRLLQSSAENIVTPIANNREKQYILNGTEPFLQLLGVSDARGRVYDRKQAKFRQINRFLELIRDIEDKLPSEKIRICDLCCGKSYLSFAVYHYFANIKHYQVSMTGVDLKSDVIEHCNKVARTLGFDGLEFLCGNICDYTPEVLPSLVISLHACDVATDFVLTRAAEWKTDVILSTPCCHHELNHNIQCPSLSFITDYSMLRQKLCDAATDALRLCRLEAQGYTTMALELIDPDETPKNIMLRAIRKKNFDPNSPSALAARERYRQAKRFLCGDSVGEFHF